MARLVLFTHVLGAILAVRPAVASRAPGARRRGPEAADAIAGEEAQRPKRKRSRRWTRLWRRRPRRSAAVGFMDEGAA